MPDRLSIHAPVLVNTIGHFAGAIIFGILFYLFVLDWRRDRHERSLLPAIAAALALGWNIGSLIALGTPVQGDAVTDVIAAVSFSVLSLLPAVLLHISLQSSARRRPILWIAGYLVSATAVILHVSDVVAVAARFHHAAILVVTIGFGILTVILLIDESRAGQTDGSGARLTGAMMLFLFAISFAHFRSDHDARAWSGEAALHHAGIPLALFVLLQDYRFLLLDAFIRFLVNAVFAAISVGAAYEANAKFALLSRAQHDPFEAGVIFAVSCGLLSLFAWARGEMQRWLTRTVFLRASSDRAATGLRDLAGKTSGHAEYLDRAATAITEFLSARRFELETRSDEQMPDRAMAVVDPARWNLPQWAQAVLPLRFAQGDSHLLVLGARRGRRRYLSEDIEILDRLGTIASEQVERMRSSEMRALVSQAELRALQAQINPHFFFNALNTLYGTIARDNRPARRLVLNLASLFRYSLSGDRMFIRLEEEMKMVRAYLEIEELRLGPKLVAKIEIDEAALQTEVPILSIQPLVENAVKHGVAARSGTGFVRLSIQESADSLTVEVSNSGAFDPSNHRGIGLANVRRRLSLCYGPASEPVVSSQMVSGEPVTTVQFRIPAGDRACL